MIICQRAVTDCHRQKMTSLLPLALLLITLASADRACDVGEECAPQDQCPDFLRQKADQLELRRGSSLYTRSVESLLKRRCGRGRVCCPCPTQRCQPVPSCPTVKGLYADFVGEDKVKASLAALRIRSLVCDKTKKAICCPSEAEIFTHTFVISQYSCQLKYLNVFLYSCNFHIVSFLFQMIV